MKEELIELAREKSFARLSPAERREVLASMTEEEYQLLRQAVLFGPQTHANATPPPDLKSSLMEQFRREKPTPFYRRPLPLWQAVAASLLLAMLVWGVKKETVQRELVTEIQVHTDTVWLEKVIWRERAPKQTRAVGESPMAPLPNFQTDTPSVRMALIQAPVELNADLSAGKGASLGDTPDLIRFFYQAPGEE